MDQVRGILLDIEGTTTPIAFVHEVLFSYARTHARDFLRDNQDSEEVRADVALLHEEHASDKSNNLEPPESIADYIDWLIDRDRKSTGLKSLQGKIWRQGYLAGSLKSQVFADVAPAFERWRAAGLRISIFSSGSVWPNNFSSRIPTPAISRSLSTVTSTRTSGKKVRRRAIARSR
jgi:enolase-phosphatase E1